MRLRTLTAAAVLTLVAAAATIHAQCVSQVQLIGVRDSGRNLLTKRMAWGGGMLAVQSSNPKTGVWITLYDGDGRELAAPALIGSNDDITVLDLLWNGTDFVLFYRLPTKEVVFQRISLTQLTDPIALRFLSAADGDQVRVLWSSTRQQYIVAHAALSASPRSVTAIYYDHKGVWVTDEDLGTAAAGSFLRIAETLTGAVGVFFEDSVAGSVRFAKPDPGRSVLTRIVWPAGQDALVAPRGELFALVRLVPAGADNTVHWIVLDSSGSEVKPDMLLMDADAGVQSIKSFTTAAGEYALTYTGPVIKGDSPYRLRRFGVDGSTLTDTPFSVQDVYEASDAVEDIVWTGSSYLAAVHDVYDVDNTVSSLARVCPLLASIDGPRTVVRGEPRTFGANVEGGFPDYGYLWRWNYTQSSAASPQLIFPAVGTYEILLTVTDAAGSEVRTSFTVTVIEPPQQGRPKRRAVRT